MKISETLSEKLSSLIIEKRNEVIATFLLDESAEIDRIRREIKAFNAKIQALEVRMATNKESDRDEKREPLKKLKNKLSADLSAAKEKMRRENAETDNTAEVFLDESTGEQYYINLDEDTLEERKIKIRITSKGERVRRITCPPGRIAKSVNGRMVCVTPTGREKLTKKLAIKQAVRKKKAKGAGFKKRVNFKRQKALKKRKAMGLRSQK